MTNRAILESAIFAASRWPDWVKVQKLPLNTGTITLEKTSWVAPEAVKVDGPDERAIVYRGGETIEWKVATKS